MLNLLQTIYSIKLINLIIKKNYINLCLFQQNISKYFFLAYNKRILKVKFDNLYHDLNIKYIYLNPNF